VKDAVVKRSLDARGNHSFAWAPVAVLGALLVSAPPAAAQNGQGRSHATGIIQASAIVVQAPQVSTLTPQEVAHLLGPPVEHGTRIDATAPSVGLSIARIRQPEMSIVIEPVDAMRANAAETLLICRASGDGPACHEQVVGVPVSLRAVPDSAPAPTLFFMSEAASDTAVFRATIAYTAN
jgi:hypothetical protein